MLKQDYRNEIERLIAVYTVTNNFSIKIYGFKYGIDDYVYACLSSDNKQTPIKAYKLYNATKKGAYFNMKGTRIYLSECIKVK